MNVLEQFSLNQRVAIVTGGSKGLGKAMAEGFVEAVANAGEFGGGSEFGVSLKGPGVSAIEADDMRQHDSDGLAMNDSEVSG